LFGDELGHRFALVTLGVDLQLDQLVGGESAVPAFPTYPAGSSACARAFNSAR
jgi:hypothetical protein